MATIVHVSPGSRPAQPRPPPCRRRRSSRRSVRSVAAPRTRRARACRWTRTEFRGRGLPVTSARAGVRTWTSASPGTALPLSSLTTVVFTVSRGATYSKRRVACARRLDTPRWSVGRHRSALPALIAGLRRADRSRVGRAAVVLAHRAAGCVGSPPAPVRPHVASSAMSGRRRARRMLPAQAVPLSEATIVFQSVGVPNVDVSRGRLTSPCYRRSDVSSSRPGIRA